jgi:hypothetical protein
VGREKPGDGDERRHVDVVAAGVHDARLGAARIAGRGLRGVGQAGPLGDGQGVEVGPQHHDRPFARAQDADDAVAADARRHLAAGLAPQARQLRRRLPLLERELRPGVELAVGLDEPRQLPRHPGPHGLVAAAGPRLDGGHRPDARHDGEDRDRVP